MSNSPIDQYAAWLRSWASDRTTTERTKLVGGRLEKWGGLAGFTAENIAEFLAGKDAPWTRATYHAHLSSFAEWAVASGLMPDNPMEGVRKTRPPRGVPRPLSEADVARVLAASGPPDRDWMLLALHAGLRVSEIAKIRGEDVQPDGIYVEGKGGTRVTLPCHPDLWAVAQRYPRRGYWFPHGDGHLSRNRISLRVGRIFRSLGLDGSIHRLRHTYGTRLLRAGAHVRKVQRLMRHANLETTANYTAVDEDELRDAILMLPSFEPPEPPAA